MISETSRVNNIVGPSRQILVLFCILAQKSELLKGIEKVSKLYPFLTGQRCYQRR